MVRLDFAAGGVAREVANVELFGSHQAGGTFDLAPLQTVFQDYTGDTEVLKYPLDGPLNGESFLIDLFAPSLRLAPPPSPCCFSLFFALLPSSVLHTLSSTAPNGL